MLAHRLKGEENKLVSPFLTNATLGSGHPSALHSRLAPADPSRTKNVDSVSANVEAPANVSEVTFGGSWRTLNVDVLA
jgi:hypothetical protein